MPGRMRVAVGVGVLATAILVLYGLAHTRHGSVLLWRLANGTRYESAAVRWYVAVNGDRVERALARGDIHDGQTVDEVVAAYGPFRVETIGRYQRLQLPADGLMFEGYGIVGKDGRLAAAAWAHCKGHVVFFNTLSEVEENEFARESAAQRERRYAAEVLARMAAGGSLLGARDPWEW